VVNATTYRKGLRMGTVLEWIVVAALFAAGLVVAKKLVVR
jgi:hypothetical protein